MLYYICKKKEVHKMITTTIYVDYENRETLSELAYVQRVIIRAKENEGIRKKAL